MPTQTVILGPSPLSSLSSVLLVLLAVLILLGVAAHAAVL
jgi:hypothetical protein